MMFTHLHCHTEYSVLDGFGNPQRWIEALEKNNMKAIAVTEHGNIDSSIKMSRICKEHGIKFVVGCEFYICEDIDKKNRQQENRHICLYAMNKQGWKNILTLLSIANIKGYHYKPRIDGDLLLKHLDGVIVSTACVFSFSRTAWGNRLLHRLSKILQDRLFFEIMPHDLEDQRIWNQEVIELADKYNGTIIATNDCHYPFKEDAELQEVCLAVNSGATWKDPKRFRFETTNFFVASKKEMRDFFLEFHSYLTPKQISQYLNNTQILVDMCENFELEQIKPDLPLSPNIPIDELREEGKNEDDYFRMLVKAGLRKKKDQLCQPIHIYRERIEEELSLLISKGFSRYFLMVIDILDFCKKEGIAVGPGRGSVGGCLVAWLTGITQVDPLKYDLLFARFQDPSRKDLPDIDLDFEMDRREEVVNYIRSIYGEQNVAQITTFLTMQGKMALQDVGRVFEIPRSEIISVTKLLEDEDFDEETLMNHPEETVRSFCHRYKKIIRLVLAIQGTIRGYGKHAAGVCISRHNLSQGVNGNLARRQGILVSNWDKDEGEYMGLMKLDILGLTALSRIRVCCEMIAKNTGKTIDLNAIDLEDRKVLKTISKGDCVGVFQLGTPGLTRYCVDLGIDSFKDVYNATALFRPGTLRSGMAQEFVKRKHGQPYKPIDPKAVKFTSDTEGIILYQEQCMFLFKELAGFDWGKCNLVRKVIAKSKGEEALNEFKNDFLQGCEKISNISLSSGEKIWASIVDFSKYAFNRSHSVEYSIISMWDAWLKTYYRGEFYASCLSYLNEDKRMEIIEEAADRGMIVRLPKYGISSAKYWNYDYETNSLVMPFNEIIGIGDTMADNIVKAGARTKKTFFGKRQDYSSLPVKVRETLKNIHAEDKNWSPTKAEIKVISPYFKYRLTRILGL